MAFRSWPSSNSSSLAPIGRRPPIVSYRTHWAAHNVRFHTAAAKTFHHPVVGELSLHFNRLDVAADHGLTLYTYAAEPGSRSEEALNLLGSWAATIDSPESARTTDRS
jgi:hypothetical protein